MRIEATPLDAESLAALLPEGGNPSDLLGVRMTQLVGETIPAPEGVTVTYDGSIHYRSVDVAPDLSFLVHVAEGVTAGVIVAWLRSRFMGRTSKLTINRRLLDLNDEGQVTRIVTEQITREED